MRTPTEACGVVGALLARLQDEPPGELHVDTRLLSGGLEAADITHVSARYRDAQGRQRVVSLVVKRLDGLARREAAVYQRLVAPHAGHCSAQLFSAEYLTTGEVVLYLEAVRPAVRWPWRELGEVRRVLEALAGLHSTALSEGSVTTLTEWNYEAELHASAVHTLELLQQHRRCLGTSSLGRVLLSARRVVLALGQMRRQLLTAAPWGSEPIHGDMHSGNALVRWRHGRHHPVLLDWGRARIGSPWEDVSSWLQSLGYWEPEVRRRHDTLLASYLAARGADARVDASTRATYWLAAASNALAGALRYHLSVALDPRVTSARRTRALHLARDWLRVLRRADAYWS